MIVSNMPRGFGKTTMLIIEAQKENAILVVRNLCGTYERMRCMGLRETDVQVITVSQLIERGNNYSSSKFMIDDIDLIDKKDIRKIYLMYGVNNILRATMSRKIVDGKVEELF